MSVWLASGFRRLLAFGAVPGRTRGRLERAAAALRRLGEGEPTGVLLEGPSTGDLFAELDLARVLGQALDRPGPAAEPLPAPRAAPTAPRPGGPIGLEGPTVRWPTAPVARARERGGRQLASARSSPPVFLVTPARVMAALAPYAPPAGAAGAGGAGRLSPGRPSQSSPRESPIFAPRPSGVSGGAANIHDVGSESWAASAAAHARVIVSAESAAGVGDILASAAPQAAAASTRGDGFRHREARDRADGPTPHERVSTAGGESLLERVLRRIPAVRPVAAAADLLVHDGSREPGGVPVGSPTARAAQGGFRGLADRAIQEASRSIAPPLSLETRIPGEAVLDRMDAAIAASVSRILVREAERNGIDLAGSLP